MIGHVLAKAIHNRSLRETKILNLLHDTHINLFVFLGLGSHDPLLSCLQAFALRFFHQSLPNLLPRRILQLSCLILVFRNCSRYFVFFLALLFVCKLMIDTIIEVLIIKFLVGPL